MGFFKVLGLISLILGTEALANKVNYDGYQVLRTSVPNSDQFEALNSLMDQNLFDFWTLPSLSTPVQIMSSPENVQILTNFMREIQLDFTLMTENVQKLIDVSESGSKRNRSNAAYELTWDDYYESEAILEYLEYLAETFDFVSTEKLASTYEGRDVMAIKIEKGGEDKKNVFIDGTSHGREWISPAVVTFLIKELVENHEANAPYVENLNFYIIPVLNPDGYDYSHQKDRMWRKTRTSEHSSDCAGVDLNRNFAYDFGGPGSSDNPCSVVYRGPEAFSEIESAALEKLFKSLSPVPELAISYHSAFDAVLYPYANKGDAFPDNKDEVIQLCDEAMEALNAVDGQNFYCMKGTDLYPVGGCSMDWYASEGVRFAYLPELRNNGYGFLLPPEFIQPSGEENWAALKVMMDKLLE